jgi:predicted DNA-binding transcriptional regulator YafY
MQNKLLQHQRHNIIIDRLKNGEELSISKLAREWEIPTKTVQRDFAKLTEGSYGIVRASDGKRFRLNKKPYTLKGADTTIKMLDSLSADIGGTFYTKAHSLLQKLQQYIESPFYTRIDVENISDKLDLMEDLEYAVSKQKMITFDYTKSQHKGIVKTYENVKPYKIIIFDGFWYLLTQYKDHYIKFYLREIKDIKILPATFKKDEIILDRMEKAIDIWFDPKAEPFDVTFLLDEYAIVYFERKPIKDQYLKKNSDGTAELTVSITNKREIFTILKKWLPQIKVIEPCELQEEFEAMLNKYLP